MSTSSAHQQSLTDAGSETRPPMLERFKMIQPDTIRDPRPETEDDLMGNALKQYEADIKAINFILISIPNDIYNSVDSCQTARAMWLRVKRLMHGTVLSLMNDLKRNKNDLPIVTINTKFLNCLQPEWIKYVTSVRLAKDSTKESYDVLFDYLQQYEKLVIASRVKKLEKTRDPLALVAHKSSSS
ncbi:hypothetical protein Tco_1217421 [Tanacetum coccineum]